MQFKNTLIEMVKLSHSQRREYIKNFLFSNNIPYKEYKYNAGVNIEVSIDGKIQNKKTIFFSHYDIAKSTKQGANDNTSSVVVMLYIAKYLKQVIPHYHTKIVFNDSEEIVGALLNRTIDTKKLSLVLKNIGSFNYLNHLPNPKEIIGVFILELSGIGDSLYIAKKSGGVICDPKLVDFLERIAKDKKIPYHIMTVPSSDILSVFTKKIPGVVFGAVPSKELLLSHEDTLFIPPTWQTIHTLSDNHIAIKESSLQLVFNFVSTFIKNFDKLN